MKELRKRRLYDYICRLCSQCAKDGGFSAQEHGALVSALVIQRLEIVSVSSIPEVHLTLFGYSLENKVTELIGEA